MSVEIFFAILIVPFVVFVIWSSNKQNEEKRTKELNKIEECKEYLKTNDFIIEKEVASNKNHLYVDEGGKKWAVVVRQFYNTRIYDFRDIIEIEIYENGNSIASGRTGSALLGGILFGGVGAIIGASGKKEINENCTSLQLRIRVNNLSNPEIIMDFIDNPVSKNGSIYKEKFESLKEFAAVLSYIQNNV